MKDYQLTLSGGDKEPQKNILEGLKKLWPLLSKEKKVLLGASVTILINSGLTLVAPMIIARGIDRYIQTGQFSGVLRYSGILMVIFLVLMAADFTQTRLMGGVGQRLLFSLRGAIFSKLQELPVAFFNQNRTGDLISRINNDTDKLNQFFAQALVQFLRNMFIMIGAGVFILYIRFELGLAALVPAIFLLVFTRAISPWVKKRNALSLQTTGGLSAEIGESLNNFKATVAFNRRDYFREKFGQANQENYLSAVKAGIANGLLTPIFSMTSNLAQLITLTLGIYMIAQGQLTIGLLIGFFAYISNFYEPLKRISTLWASFQTAMAAWDRIAIILGLESDLLVSTEKITKETSALLEFENVYFCYPNGKMVLKDISLKLEKGKTYALVGPTGGGKTTTASLMARLYDPAKGMVFLDGQDIRSFTPKERAQKIGFILQEPYLFNGTLKENIFYGHDAYSALNDEQALGLLQSKHLESLLGRFESGLATPISTGGEAVSLGQKQLIAFIRAVLRDPQLLILDEATANIDTVTEQLLEEVLGKLPASTTKVIIAHRLNTIENADEIFFINSGMITPAGSFDEAVKMILEGRRES